MHGILRKNFYFPNDVGSKHLYEYTYLQFYNLYHKERYFHQHIKTQLRKLINSNIHFVHANESIKHRHSDENRH